MKTIELKKKKCNAMWTEVTCSITEKLDELAGFEKDSHYKHYMIFDTERTKTIIDGLTCIAIRVPGVTSGCVSVDDDNTIRKIEIYTNRVTVPKYKPDFQDVINEFIGQKLESKILKIS